MLKASVSLYIWTMVVCVISFLLMMIWSEEGKAEHFLDGYKTCIIYFRDQKKPYIVFAKGQHI